MVRIVENIRDNDHFLGEDVGVLFGFLVWFLINVEMFHVEGALMFHLDGGRRDGGREDN